MDEVLNLVDYYVFTPYVYPASWPEDNPWRQLFTLNIIVNVGGILLYLITASLAYFFIFDKRLLKHPQILEVMYGMCTTTVFKTCNVAIHL